MMASAAYGEDDADSYYSRMLQAAQEQSVVSAEAQTSSVSPPCISPPVPASETSVKYQPPPAKDFEKMAKINAVINRMTVSQVREELSTLRLDSRYIQNFSNG